MSVSHKSSSTQTFRLMVYSRPLHPELFNLQARRIDRHGDYEAENWVTPAGHLVRFSYDNAVLTEAVIENADHLPEHGLIHALPCLGEKEFEYEPTEEDKIGYVTTIQTEALTDNLYTATLREMQDFARETGSLSHYYKDEDGTPCLSVLDTQKYKREYHMQSYHLLGASGLVLRTQSIFEVLAK
jgi:Protein of unknown function DUF2617